MTPCLLIAVNLALALDDTPLSGAAAPIGQDAPLLDALLALHGDERVAAIKKLGEIGDPRAVPVRHAPRYRRTCGSRDEPGVQPFARDRLRGHRPRRQRCFCREVDRVLELAERVEALQDDGYADWPGRPAGSSRRAA